MSRKDEKSVALEDKDRGDKENRKIEPTKILELVPTRKPEQVRIGEVIRFMHSPENNLSAYWMQGEIEKRIDRHTVARASRFTRNRVRRGTAWSLGKEVEFGTIGEEQAILLEQSNLCGTSDDNEDETDDAIASNLESKSVDMIRPGLKLQNNVENEQEQRKNMETRLILSCRPRNKLGDILTEETD